jgi:heme exporter protein D
MPDLGQHAVWVLSAYAGSLAMLAAIVWLTVRRWRRLRAELDQQEGRRDG